MLLDDRTLLAEEEGGYDESDALARPPSPVPRDRSGRRRGALVAAGLASGLLVAGAVRWSSSAPAGVDDASAFAGASEVRLCGPTEADTDFVYVGSWFAHLDHVPSVAECCSLCQQEERCNGFTWVKDAGLPTGNPGQCWLKSGRMTGKTAKIGVVSGFREAHTTKEGKADAVAASVAQHTPASPSVAAAIDIMAAKLGGDEGGKEDDSDEDGGTKGEEEKEVADAPECSKLGEGCMSSKCCQEPGTQCFSKDDYWAQCLTSCEPGPNPQDQVSPMPWACKALGKRTPGTPTECAKGEENCLDLQCCAESGKQCFRKNSTFAQCKPSCHPGPDLTAKDWLPWECKALGSKALGAAPWVAEKCAKEGSDCRQAKCCASPGQQCYMMNEFWGECRPSCQEGKPKFAGGPPWKCTEVGMRTPDLANDPQEPQGRVSEWVTSRCAGLGENCIESQCCKEVDAQCFTKNRYWGSCKIECSTEPDPQDKNQSWSCDAVGPRAWGLATKGYPSLYCISLYMPSRYEGPLLKEQLNQNAGIFQCDGYNVFAAEPDTLGTSKDGILVKATLIPKITVGVSQDGTAGNAKLFMALWDKIISLGNFRYYDWSIKVDPDAVIVPWRIRTHMKSQTGKNLYVVNCNKFPGSPNFPMMYGAVEIFSQKAMIAYAMGSWKCGTQLPWGSWGEDYYMTHCLDYLGVGRINDFGVLGDQLCTGANCFDTFVGSFHPFKDQASWFRCWGEATAPPAHP